MDVMIIDDTHKQTALKTHFFIDGLFVRHIAQAQGK